MARFGKDREVKNMKIEGVSVYRDYDMGVARRRIPQGEPIKIISPGHARALHTYTIHCQALTYGTTLSSNQLLKGENRTIF